MQIRPAAPSEIDRIMGIYAQARRYMAEHGNASQWGTSDPAREKIEADIARGRCQVGVDEADVPHFVFALIEEPDPCYQTIYDGAWLNAEPYLTLHRVASDGSTHGVLSACVEHAGTRARTLGVRNLRIDTHENNLTMQRALRRAGFAPCGTIHLQNGSPRLAYQLVLE